MTEQVTRFSIKGMITPVVKEQEYLLGDTVLYIDTLYIVIDITNDYFSGDSRLPYRKVVLRKK